MVRAFTHYCGNRAHPLLVFGFIAKKIRAIALSSESRVLTTSRFARTVDFTTQGATLLEC
jgi:hypothetical protein